MQGIIRCLGEGPRMVKGTDLGGLVKNKHRENREKIRQIQSDEYKQIAGQHTCLAMPSTWSPVCPAFLWNSTANHSSKREVCVCLRASSCREDHR